MRLARFIKSGSRSGKASHEKWTRLDRRVADLRLLVAVIAIILAILIFRRLAIGYGWLGLAVGSLCRAGVVARADSQDGRSDAPGSRFLYEGSGSARRTLGRHGRDRRKSFSITIILMPPTSTFLAAGRCLSVSARRGREPARRPSPPGCLRRRACGLILERQTAITELRPRLDLREDLELLGQEIRTGIDPAALKAWGKADRVFTGPSVPIVATVTRHSGDGRDHRMAVSLHRSRSDAGRAGDRWRADAAARDAASRPCCRLSISGRTTWCSWRNCSGGSNVSHSIRRCSNGWKRRCATDGLACLGPDRPARAAASVARLPAEPDLHAAGGDLALDDPARAYGSTPGARARAMRSRNGWPPWANLRRSCSWRRTRPRTRSIRSRSSRRGRLAMKRLELGHPLIPRRDCVRNDVSLGSGGQVYIVSGSNMSGKSTLLRSVGINAVLALAGAPVRAQSLRLAPLAVGATLRIQDSLQAGRSRFYAEITRVRAASSTVPKGRCRSCSCLTSCFMAPTRTTAAVGAESVLRGLIERGAIGLITTHDLALAQDRRQPRAAGRQRPFRGPSRERHHAL